MTNKFLLITLIFFSFFNLYLTENDEEFEYDPKIEITINSNPSKEIIDSGSQWNSWARGVGEFYFKYEKPKEHIFMKDMEIYIHPQKNGKLKLEIILNFPKILFVFGIFNNL